MDMPQSSYPCRSLINETSERFLRLTSNTNTNHGNPAHNHAAIEGRAAHINNVVGAGQRVCSACNGYYGPAFNQHVCATCHAFLYAQDVDAEVGNLQQLMSADLEPRGMRDEDDSDR